MTNDYEIALQAARILVEKKEPMTISQLALLLGISKTKIKDCLVNQKDTLFEIGIDIDIKQHVGCVAKIVDYENYVHSVVEGDSMIIPNSLDDIKKRESMFIGKLVCSESYILVDDLSKEMAISRSSTLRTLNHIKEEIKPYHLFIESKPYKGIRLCGNEGDIRNFCNDYYIYNSPYYRVMKDAPGVANEFITVSDIHCKQICQILRKNLNDEFLLHIPAAEMDLTLHLITAINRNKVGGFLSFSKNVEEKVNQLKEKKIAEKIIHEVSNTCKCKLSAEEVIYLAIKLNCYFAGYDNHYCHQSELMIKYVLNVIKKKYGFDFVSNYYLISHLVHCLSMALACHEWNVKTYNILMNYDEKGDTIGKQLTNFTLNLLNEEYKLTIKINDIISMTPFFDLAYLMKQNEKHQLIKIAIIDFPTGSMDLLEYKLKKAINVSIELQSFSSLLLEKEELKKCDFCVALENPMEKINIPLLLINPFIKDHDVQKIVSFIMNKLNK